VAKKQTQFKAKKANLLAFSVLRKESQGLRSADSVKKRKRDLKKQSQKGKNESKSGVNSWLI